MQRYLHLFDKIEVPAASPSGSREMIVVRIGSGRLLMFTSFFLLPLARARLDFDSAPAIVVFVCPKSKVVES